jgi:hypothetical protein
MIEFLAEVDPKTVATNLDPMTVTTALVGGMGALSTAVVHLYRSQFTLQKDVNDKISKELTECKEDRRSLWQAVLKIDPCRSSGDRCILGKLRSSSRGDQCTQ